MKSNGKIFCLGLPRTGTLSLCTALNILDIPTKHFPFALFYNRNHKMLNAYKAFGDTPIPLIYKELDQKYPNSKFILTTRSRETWIRSMRWLFTHGSAHWTWTPDIYRYCEEFFGTNRFNRKVLEKKFLDYHQEIHHYFSNRKNEILILDIEKGVTFGMICEFVERPFIEAVYPNLNIRMDVSRVARLKHLIQRKVPGLYSLYLTVRKKYQMPKAGECK